MDYDLEAQMDETKLQSFTPLTPLLIYFRLSIVVMVGPRVGEQHNLVNRPAYFLDPIAWTIFPIFYTPYHQFVRSFSSENPVYVYPKA